MRDSFHSPFGIRIDPGEHFLEVPVRGDALYSDLCLRAFDDPVTGRGLGVFARRRDGGLDVYHPPSLRPAPLGRAVGRAAASLHVRPLESARFEVGGEAPHVAVSFFDEQGRDIEIRLDHVGWGGGRDLLAPPRSGVDTSASLPLAYLFDGGFVPRAAWEGTVRIAGRGRSAGRHRGAGFRYARQPFLVRLNPNRTGPLAPLRVSDHHAVDAEGTIHDLRLRSTGWATRRLTAGDYRRAVHLAFDPPFPDPVALPPGRREEGTFDIRSEPEVGPIRGVWRVRAGRTRVELALRPVGGWLPRDRGHPLRRLIPGESTLRRWPAAYRWDAVIRREGLSIAARWRRLRSSP